ncbi:MAG: hypothetical protein ACI8W7_003585 [Gammaproteobacteria bacterium]|jgi:hypothetical protein
MLKAVQVGAMRKKYKPWRLYRHSKSCNRLAVWRNAVDAAALSDAVCGELSGDALGIDRRFCHRTTRAKAPSRREVRALWHAGKQGGELEFFGLGVWDQLPRDIDP